MSEDNGMAVYNNYKKARGLYCSVEIDALHKVQDDPDAMESVIDMIHRDYRIKKAEFYASYKDFLSQMTGGMPYV